MSSESNCIFCKIISGEATGDVLYEDEEIIIFKDIKPASKFHFLSVPKKHIPHVNNLTSEHKVLLNKLVLDVKRVLKENGADLNDCRLGFHLPPFNSISHLHLHAISPVSEMSFISRIIFKPDTWWFSSIDRVVEKFNSNEQLKAGKL